MPAAVLIIPVMLAGLLLLLLVFTVATPIRVGEVKEPELFDNCAVKVLVPLKPVKPKFIVTEVGVFAQKVAGVTVLIVIVCPIAAFIKNILASVIAIERNLDLLNNGFIKQYFGVQKAFIWEEGVIQCFHKLSITRRERDK